LLSIYRRLHLGERITGLVQRNKRKKGGRDVRADDIMSYV